MEILNTFLNSNEWQWRLARTIVQGVLSIAISNLDLLLGYVIYDISLRPVVVALLMAILSPIMAEIGVHMDNQESGLHAKSE